MSSKKNRVKIPTKEERITNAVRKVKNNVNDFDAWQEVMYAFVSSFRQGSGLIWEQGDDAIRKGLENSETIAPTVERNKDLLSDWSTRIEGDIKNG